MDNRLSLGDLEAFAAQVGETRAKKLFSLLGKDQQFINALSTPLGQELMRVVIDQCETLLDKIIAEEANPQETADYRAYRTIALNWAKRTSNYLNRLEKIKG